ncbi:hypothetical protein Tco_0683930 [Tanacetum coccineum]
MLEAPSEGYGMAIVSVPEITCGQLLSLSDGLLTLVQNKQFFGHDKEDPSCSIGIISQDSSLYEFHERLQYEQFYPGISPNVAELKDMVKALLLDKKNQSQAPATVKAVEENCVTCGGAHSYQTYPATDGNVYRDNIQEYVSQAAADNLNQGNTGYRAPIANQIRPPDFPPAGFSSCNTVASDPINDLNANHYARSGVAYQGPTIPTTFSSTPLKNRKRCVEDTNLSKLGDKRVPFMVKEKHFVLASMISMLENSELRSDKAQVNCDCLELTQRPLSRLGGYVRTEFSLGHVLVFLRRIIKIVPKFPDPMTHLLAENRCSFIFSDECIQAFETLKKKLTEAPILIGPSDCDLPF